MNRSQLAYSLLAIFTLQGACLAQMQVTAGIPGGSAEVISLDSRRQSVHIQPELHRDRGWPCWWYFRLDDLTIGKLINVSVSANPAPFRKSEVLNHTWSLPDRASISSDNVTWKQTPNARRNGGSAAYAFDAEAETMWVAWGPPFLPSDAAALLRQVAATLPDAEVFELARTKGGRPVYAVEFSAPRTLEAKRSAIWIQARQHAWEAGSSWVAQGFLNWASSDDPLAVELREKAILCVVPIMDVDNVTDGAGGKASTPRDHNRDWSDAPIYPEVRAAQRAIKKLNVRHRFDLFVDLHNPGPSDRRPFFYGPKIEELPTIQRSNYLKWQEIARTLIGDLEPDYRYAAYLTTDEERRRFSANWARTHTSPHVVAVTLETAWNRPQGTQLGYQAVGKQLGQAVAHYLATDPSDD